jgi:hypothetical protein
MRLERVEPLLEARHVGRRRGRRRRQLAAALQPLDPLLERDTAGKDRTGERKQRQSDHE